MLEHLKRDEVVAFFTARARGSSSPKRKAEFVSIPEIARLRAKIARGPVLRAPAKAGKRYDGAPATPPVVSGAAEGHRAGP